MSEQETIKAQEKEKPGEIDEIDRLKREREEWERQYNDPGAIGTGTATGLAVSAQEYGKKVADAASTAKDYVSDKMTPVVDKFKDLQNTDYKEVANQAKDYARQNPGQAILISAAAGLVIGLLIRGSRR
jgi:ElaB/YqjD/DUF883 family membrane-anchored ribosome-binding protein